MVRERRPCVCGEMIECAPALLSSRHQSQNAWRKLPLTALGYLAN